MPREGGDQEVRGIIVQQNLSITLLKKLPLEPARHEGRKDTTSIDARASNAHSSKHGETCCGETDHRIQELPHTTVEQEDHARKVSSQKVDSSIRKAPRSRIVESRPEAKSSAQPSQWEVEGHDPEHGERGVFRNVWALQKFTVLTVWRTWGTCLYLTEKTNKLNRDRFDTISIPQQRIYHATHISANRANKNEKNSLLERFQNCPIYRASQLAIGWVEAFCAHDDELSNEDHTYVCTAEEHKIRENSWVLALNSHGKKRSNETTRRLRPSHQNSRALSRRTKRS